MLLTDLPNIAVPGDFRPTRIFYAQFCVLLKQPAQLIMICVFSLLILFFVILTQNILCIEIHTKATSDFIMP